MGSLSYGATITIDFGLSFGAPATEVDLTNTQVPEPMTLVLVGLDAVVLRKRQK